MASRPHPLDPLSPAEVTAVAAACRAHGAALNLPPLRFNTIMLEEPEKPVLLAWQTGRGPYPRRQGLAVIIIPARNQALEAVVDLPLPEPTASMPHHISSQTLPKSVASAPGGPGKVVSWTPIPAGSQPLTNGDDNALVETVAKEDPRVIQLVKERYGVDMDQVIVDPWSVHGAPDELNHRRLMQGFFFLKRGPLDNEYAHPLDLTVIVDLNEEKVVRIDTYRERPARIPTTCYNYHRDLQTVGTRSDLKPLHVVQPEGPSFQVDGYQVRWLGWRFQVGFNPREGLIIHQVGHEDVAPSCAGTPEGQPVDPLAPESNQQQQQPPLNTGLGQGRPPAVSGSLLNQGAGGSSGASSSLGGRRVRPILHRASLVEMCVPYADPSFPYTRKCAFDLGDYGFGFSANSLELGCDCLGHIHYFDAVINNAQGEPVVIPRAICMHEEDAGLLWKHYDYRSGAAEVRRSRRLVVSMISTFMNYEYCTYWLFHQDGTFGFEVRLTGLLSTHPVPAGQEESLPEYGTLVAPGVNAAFHQHFFCVRMDPVIDDQEGGGSGLIVSEVDAVIVPRGPNNPEGNAFAAKETDILAPSSAAREAAPLLGRTWKVRNPKVLNPMARQPVAYRLFPAACPPLLAQPDSLAAQRGLFTQKALVVTNYHHSQRFPAGNHVVQSRRDTGLAEWLSEAQAQGRPLGGPGADPVLWYTWGVTHFPRTEDWPVMPTEALGFQFRPCNFFRFNPALDAPPEKDKMSRLAPGSSGASASNRCDSCPASSDAAAKPGLPMSRL